MFSHIPIICFSFFTSNLTQMCIFSDAIAWYACNDLSKAHDFQLGSTTLCEIAFSIKYNNIHFILCKILLNHESKKKMFCNKWSSQCWGSFCWLDGQVWSFGLVSVFSTQNYYCQRVHTHFGISFKDLKSITLFYVCFFLAYGFICSIIVNVLLFFLLREWRGCEPLM